MRLKAAGEHRHFENIVSGNTFDRPGLKTLLDYARSGDALASAFIATAFAQDPACRRVSGTRSHLISLQSGTSFRRFRHPRSRAASLLVGK